MCACIHAACIYALQVALAVKHLPNVQTRFYCPQVFLSGDFQCKDGVSELK